MAAPDLWSHEKAIDECTLIQSRLTGRQPSGLFSMLFEATVNSGRGLSAPEILARRRVTSPQLGVSAIHQEARTLRKLLEDHSRRRQSADPLFQITLPLARRGKPYKLHIRKLRESPPTTTKSHKGEGYITDAERAWKTMTAGENMAEAYRHLIDYYRDRGVEPFEYRQANGQSKQVALYVRPEWKELNDTCLVKDPHFQNITHEYSPEPFEREFSQLYPELRKALKLGKMTNGHIFRLVRLEQRARQLHLYFERGRFFDAVMCQYCLEHELYLMLYRAASGAQFKLPFRDSKAAFPFGFRRRLLMTHLREPEVSPGLLRCNQSVACQDRASPAE